ncbi:hypothetical protein DFP73DRAFT_227368 [Morchella snyderi]|nr:hypothetical protein DFP73DRAFT_227368 [Morchella snyderi]
MDGPTVNFGEELKDAFKPVYAWTANGIEFLDDAQAFYRERAALEKDYATKMSALTKKFLDRKAKKASILSVGDTPQMTPGSLESASVTTWSTILTSHDSLAKEHDNLSNALITQISDPLKAIATRYEEYRKLYNTLNMKVMADRDSVYSELKKSKGSYDAECKQVEDKRAKVDKAYDSSKTKAEKSYSQELIEMHNIKNTYLIKINVANRHKQKYYHEDIPDILNSLQDLNETRVTKINSIWTLGCQLDINCRQNSITILSDTVKEITRNLPALDSAMFSRHNMGGWVEPNNFEFEPSQIWHDTSDIVVDDLATVFLRNILGKSRKELEGAKAQVDARNREIEGLRKTRDSIKLNEEMQLKEAEVTRSLLIHQEQLVPHSSKLTTLQVEISTILNAVGDVERGTQTHKFKSKTFTIPTTCDLCGERAWRLTGAGFSCQDCGYTCHAKCEMKVPAQCPGVLDKAGKKALKEEMKTTAPATGGDSGVALSRSNTMNSLSSSYAVGGGGATVPQRMGSTLSRTTSPAANTPAETAVPAASNLNAVATATSPAVRRNRVIAPPPERYVSAPPPEAPEPSAEKDEVVGRMLYAYSANGAGEISVEGGQEVVIVEPDDGSGWIQVQVGSLSGLVPASYVDASPPPSTPIGGRPDSRHSSSNVSISNSIVGSMTGSGTIKKKGPAVKPKRGAKRVKHVEALYEYSARSDLEWGMLEGDRFVLVKEDSGDGWCEVEKGGVTKSVPSAYVQVID